MLRSAFASTPPTAHAGNFDTEARTGTFAWAMHDAQRCVDATRYPRILSTRKGRVNPGRFVALFREGCRVSIDTSELDFFHPQKKKKVERQETLKNVSIINTGKKKLDWPSDKKSQRVVLICDTFRLKRMYTFSPMNARVSRGRTRLQFVRLRIWHFPRSGVEVVGSRRTDHQAWHGALSLGFPDDPRSPVVARPRDPATRATLCACWRRGRCRSSGLADGCFPASANPHTRRRRSTRFLKRSGAPPGRRRCSRRTARGSRSCPPSTGATCFSCTRNG